MLDVTTHNIKIPCYKTNIFQPSTLIYKPRCAQIYNQLFYACGLLTLFNKRIQNNGEIILILKLGLSKMVCVCVRKKKKHAFFSFPVALLLGTAMFVFRLIYLEILLSHMAVFQMNNSSTGSP